MFSQALPSRKEENRLHHLYAQCIGKMYTLGYPVSFHMLQDQSHGTFIRYPTYSWQETDLWAKDDYNVPQKTLLLLGVPVSVNSKSAQWENEIDLHQFEFLNDHKMKAAGIYRLTLEYTRVFPLVIGFEFSEFRLRSYAYSTAPGIFTPFQNTQHKIRKYEGG